MSQQRQRRRVASEAARLIFSREESQLFRARMKAARSICSGRLRPGDLPTPREIRREVEVLAAYHEADEPDRSVEPSAADGSSGAGMAADRFRVYELLLLPLEHVRENPQTHPEGDVLYHSLQVFELARERLPYDEEFLLAALLHDVGKAIDRRDHVAAGLDALAGHVTPRTAWLIEHHTEALSLKRGNLGIRGRRRLEASDDYDELMLLADCDIAGRAVGVVVPDVQDAIEYVRDLAEVCGE